MSGTCSWRRDAQRQLSAALLRFLPAVSVSVGVDVHRVLTLSLCLVLALLFGPQHHVGESHKHLDREKRREWCVTLLLGQKCECNEPNVACSYKPTENEQQVISHNTVPE